MKVREYLNLVKYLDSKNRNELKRFILKPIFDISAKINPIALSGSWTFQNDIEFPEQYAYMLEFYVVSDRNDFSHQSFDGDNLYGSIVLEVTPQQMHSEPRIAEEIFDEILKNAMDEHDKSIEKRNGGKWFIWQ